MPDCWCNVTLKNELSCSLTLKSKPVNDGYWDSAPADSVAADSSMSCTLKDYFGAYGSKGSFTYTVNDSDVERNVDLFASFECPNGWWNDNQCSASTNILQKLYIVTIEGFSKSGSPLTVTITIKYDKYIPINTTISDIFVTNPVVPIINSKGTASTFVSIGQSPKAVQIWNRWWQDNSVKDDSYNSVAGSYYPTAIDALSSSATLTISLSDDYAISDIPLRLVGRLNGAVVVDSDRNRLYEGKTNTRLTLKSKNPGTVSGFSGDITWTLSVLPTRQEITLPSTRVEVYGLSASLPNYYQNGVPVNLLRWIALPAPAKRSEYTAHVADYVMTKTGYKFDSISGASWFGVKPIGVNFNLSTWLTLMNKPVNYRCNSYDQSAAVQVCLDLAPGTSSKPWAFLSPYGYINKTTLTGWSGDCNNPLFKEKTDKMVLKINDPDRTGFQQYAFISSNSKVVDSAIGPYDGSKSVSEYLDSVLDTKTNLYDEEGMGLTAYGNASDVIYYDGVHMLDSIAASSSTQSLRRLNAVEKVMNLAINPTKPDVMHSNADFRALEYSLTQKFTGKVVLSEVRMCTEHSESQLVIQSDEAALSLSVLVYSDHMEAVRGMAESLDAYVAEVDRLFERPRPGREKGQLHVVTRSSPEKSLWVFGNAFINIASLTPGFPIEEYAEHVNEHFASKQVLPGQEFLPQLHNLIGDTENNTYTLGQVFSVHANVDGCASAYVVASHGKVRLVEEDLTHMRFSFQASGVGEEAITFTFAHSTTHRVVSGKLNVTVVQPDELALKV